MEKFIDFEEEEWLDYYNQNGTMVSTDPFVWQYNTLDGFIKIEDAFTLSEKMLFVKTNQLFKKEYLRTNENLHFDKRGWCDDKYYEARLKEWSKFSDYMMTTFTDWGGLLFMSLDKQIVEFFTVSMRAEGYKLD